MNPPKQVSRSTGLRPAGLAPRAAAIIAVTVLGSVVGLGNTRAALSSGYAGPHHSIQGVVASRADSVSSLMSHLTLRQKVGQMLMVSFSGTSLTQSTVQMLRTLQPDGVTLFGDNFSSPAQLKNLDHSLQIHSHIPLFISVDQEGGEVTRITSGVKQLPSERQYGLTGSPGTVGRDAATEAVQLRRLGVNMNLAPVLDVAGNPNSIIAQEQRSYGPNSQRVAALGLASIHGYQSNGVAATAKHVLGLGTTPVNPETQLPSIRLTPQQLHRQLLPFRAASKAGVDAMMVTHIILRGITAPTTPASLSHKVVTGILRQQLGFRGVIMTDSLSMGAVTGRFGIARACSMAVQAGADILLIAGGGPMSSAPFVQCVDMVVAKVNAHEIWMGRIDQSVTRILRLKQKLHLGLPKA